MQKLFEKNQCVYLVEFSLFTLYVWNEIYNFIVAHLDFCQSSCQSPILISHLTLNGPTFLWKFSNLYNVFHKLFDLLGRLRNDYLDFLLFQQIWLSTKKIDKCKQNNNRRVELVKNRENQNLVFCLKAGSNCISLLRKMLQTQYLTHA